jgi:hypothetical protein
MMIAANSRTQILSRTVLHHNRKETSPMQLMPEYGIVIPKGVTRFRKVVSWTNLA